MAGRSLSVLSHQQVTEAIASPTLTPVFCEWTRPFKQGGYKVLQPFQGRHPGSEGVPPPLPAQSKLEPSPTCTVCQGQEDQRSSQGLGRVKVKRTKGQVKVKVKRTKLRNISCDRGGMPPSTGGGVTGGVAVANSTADHTPRLQTGVRCHIHIIYIKKKSFGA